MGNNAIFVLLHANNKALQPLFDHVQQQIWNAYFLLLVVDQNINHIAFTINDGFISISFFSVLFIELQEQHSYSNYPYIVSFEEFMSHYYGLKINKE